MSKWLTQREAFVWTEIDGQSFGLLFFNQSRGGVYVFYPTQHLSYHTDGNSHGKFDATNTVIPIGDPPLADISVRWLGEILMPLDPETVTRMGEPISRPESKSRALFVDREIVGPNMLTTASCVHNPDSRPTVDEFCHRSAAYRPNMDFLAERIYECEDHGKILSVFAFRTRLVPPEGGGVKPAPF